MGDPEIIEGEFRVIGTGEFAPELSYAEPLADRAWSFWLDDMPNLVSIAATILAAYLARVFLF